MFLYHLYKETIAKKVIMTGFNHQRLDDLDSETRCVLYDQRGEQEEKTHIQRAAKYRQLLLCYMGQLTNKYLYSFD